MFFFIKYWRGTYIFKKYVTSPNHSFTSRSRKDTFRSYLFRSFLVVDCSDKNVMINMENKEVVVSIDRVKPAYIDGYYILIHKVNPTVTPNPKSSKKSSKKFVSHNLTKKYWPGTCTN